MSREPLTMSQARGLLYQLVLDLPAAVIVDLLAQVLAVGVQHDQIPVPASGQMALEAAYFRAMKGFPVVERTAAVNAWTAHAYAVRCPTCGAAPGDDCRLPASDAESGSGEPFTGAEIPRYVHVARIREVAPKR